MKNLKSNSKGYTLIQLIVVIAILGILTAVTVPVYLNARGKAQDALAAATLEAMKTSLDMYAAHNGYYPQNVYTVTELLIALGRDFPNNVRFDGSAGSLIAVATNSMGSGYYIYAIGRDENHYFGLSNNSPIAGPDTLFNCKVSVDINKPLIGRLVALLKDPNSVVRNGAVKKLGEIKDPRAIGALSEMLEDKDSTVQESAKKAIIEINGNNLEEK
ncbi:MAG: HEAT repeat domain-containing protein [bacterium]|nr:HEAT repeat domain-containing protein [bacterium]